MIPALVVSGLALGVALRIWILLSSQGALDGDEAVWGLMAKHVLAGQIPTFYWGQAYGGSQETLVAAALFWMFGVGTTALKVTPILFWAAATVLLWRVGRRTLGEPRARIAAALFWMWPVYFVWKSTFAHGFYGAGLVFGLWAMLAALRLRERSRRLDLVSLGVALGLGWWATPEVAILGLPAVLWLAWERRDVIRGIWIAAPAFALGSLPWWIWNVRHHWGSLHTGRDETSKFGHLHNLVSTTLPTALGLRLPFSLSWLPNVEIGGALYVVALAGFAWLLVRRPRGVGLPLLAAAVFPVLYSVSPYTWLTTEPRYLTLIAPIIVVLVVSAARSAERALALFVVAAAFSIAGVALMESRDLAGAHTGGVAVPADFTPLLRTLYEHRATRLWASYWIAYRITFESDERIVAAEPASAGYAVRDSRVVPTGKGSVISWGRHAAYQLEVNRSPRAAFVFVSGEPTERPARPLLRRERYALVRTDGFDVWFPPAR
ncbi:MAG TPA: glycosyltransferase family 39 protein [Gaiellaceae bacterium]|nr:glycosyltransferase family 39 protein [Gaiellaceae bacterium]